MECLLKTSSLSRYYIRKDKCVSICKIWILAPIPTKITPSWCWLSRPKIQWNVGAVRKIWQHLFSSCSLRIKIMDIITRLDFSCHFFAQQETFFSTMVVVVFLMTKEKSCRKLTFLASDEKSNKTVRWRRKGLFRPIARFFYQMLSRLNQWKWQGDGSPLFCPRRIITFLALKHKKCKKWWYFESLCFSIFNTEVFCGR